MTDSRRRQGTVGREILLSPASQYAAPTEEPLSFATLSERARARGEIAIGVFLDGEASPTLNPPKDLQLRLGAGDKVVIVGEGF